MSERFDAEHAGERFPSVVAIRVAHADLLKRQTAAEGSPIQLLAEIDEFVIRARATGALLDDEDDRWLVQGVLDYWGAALLRVGRTINDTTLDEFVPQLAPHIPDEQCPFVGLDAFQESDASKFFGRRRLVADVVALIERTPLVVIFGQSGSGKSSLLRSGVIPALKRGALAGSDRWRYLPPLVPGSDPLGALLRCVNELAADSNVRSVEATQSLAAPGALHAALSRSEAPVVLSIDQFEELFTLTEDRQQRQAFVSQLLAITDDSTPRHVVLVTMRSDYETFVAQIPELQRRLEGRTFRITPMDATELREAIEGPSAAVGLRFEAGVVDALLADTLGEPAALPLLQFTLWKLWNHRARNRVTWDAYKELGGGRRALARSADAFYDHLIPENQVTARRILLRMVRPGDGLEVTSNRIRRAALFERSDDPDRVGRVLELLIEQRLVRLSSGQTREDDQVEVAHEALVRNWPQLVDWLEQERQEIATRRRLEAKAAEWKRLGSGVSALLDEAQLYEAERWLQGPAAKALGYDPALTALVQASRAALDAARVEAERGRSRAYAQRLILVSVAAVALFLGALSWVYVSRRDSQQANSRTISFYATKNSQSDLPLALLYSVEALSTAPTFEARSSLLTLLGKSPNLIKFLHGHTDPVRSVAFAPDGNLAASAASGGASDGTIILWDLEAGTRRQAMKRDTPALSIAFSPNGRLFAAGNLDGTVVLWDTKTWKVAKSFSAGQKDVRSIAFSNAGNRLAAGAFDGSVVFWDVSDSDQQRSLDAVSPVILSEGLDAVSSVALNPAGTLLASGHWNGSVRLWDLARRGQSKELKKPSPSAAVLSLAFDPDGRVLVSGSSDGKIHVWNVKTATLLRLLITFQEAVRSVAISPDGRMLAAGGEDKTIRLWDIAPEDASGWGITVRQLLQGGHSSSIGGVAFSPDGRRLVSGGWDSKLILWDLVKESLVDEFRPQERGKSIQSLAWSDDGKQLAWLDADRHVTTRNLGTNIEDIIDRSMPAASSVTLTFAPNGELVWSGIDAEGFSRRGVLGGQRIGPAVQLSGHDPTAPAVSSDGRLFAYGTRTDGDSNSMYEIIVWDVEGGRELQKFPSTTSVDSLTFSRNGRILASTGGEKAVTLWNPSTGEELGRLTGHDTALAILTFSLDANYLAAGTRGTLDSSIFIWDLPAGRLLGLLSTGDRGVRSLAFSPDGEYLASVDKSTDGTVRIWNLTSNALRKQACDAANRQLSPEEWRIISGPRPTARDTCAR